MSKKSSEERFGSRAIWERRRLLPVVLHAESEYAQRLPEARERLRDRDPEDAHALALAWTLGLPLWSNDRDFEGQAVRRYTTAQLLRDRGYPSPSPGDVGAAASRRVLKLARSDDPQRLQSRLPRAQVNRFREGEP
jgi:hypothetical protein